MMATVYVAGPHMDDEFRTLVEAFLYDSNVVPFDPIQARDFRGREIHNEAEVVEGDLADVLRLDGVIGNYSVPGWGTGMETWFAHSLHKPIFAYVHRDARVSPWVAYVAGGYDNVYRKISDACGAAKEHFDA